MQGRCCGRVPVRGAKPQPVDGGCAGVVRRTEVLTDVRAWARRPAAPRRADAWCRYGEHHGDRAQHDHQDQRAEAEHGPVEGDAPRRIDADGPRRSGGRGESHRIRRREDVPPRRWHRTHRSVRRCVVVAGGRPSARSTSRSSDPARSCRPMSWPAIRNVASAAMRPKTPSAIDSGSIAALGLGLVDRRDVHVRAQERTESAQLRFDCRHVAGAVVEHERRRRSTGRSTPRAGVRVPARTARSSSPQRRRRPARRRCCARRSRRASGPCGGTGGVGIDRHSGPARLPAAFV